MPEQLAEDGIDSLAIEHAHALRVARLPSHHSDPFDRLLVAQAQLERCAFLTADVQILDYDIETVWGGRQGPAAPEAPSPHLKVPRRPVGRGQAGGDGVRLEEDVGRHARPPR